MRVKEFVTEGPISWLSKQADKIANIGRSSSERSEIEQDRQIQQTADALYQQFQNQVRIANKSSMAMTGTPISEQEYWNILNGFSEKMIGITGARVLDASGPEQQRVDQAEDDIVRLASNPQKLKQAFVPYTLALMSAKRALIARRQLSPGREKAKPTTPQTTDVPAGATIPVADSKFTWDGKSWKSQSGEEPSKDFQQKLTKAYLALQK